MTPILPMNDLIWHASLAYLAFVVLLPRLWVYLEETNWIRVIFLYQPAVIYLPPPLALLLASLAALQPASALVNVGTAVFVVFTVMRLRTNRPRVPDPSPDRVHLRILSYNIFGGNHPGNAGLLAVLQSAEADIIFLQEAWWAIPGRERNPLEHILPAFDGWHLARSSPFFELCILSRLPLFDVHERPIAGRKCLVAHVEVGGRRLRLVNVHLTPPATRPGFVKHFPRFREYLMGNARARREEAAALRDLVLEVDMSTIACGDFNSPPQSSIRRAFPGSYRDAFDEVGSGFGHTYPDGLPLWRLDYILTSPDIEPVWCLPLAVHASDHLPVLAGVEVPTEG